MNSFNGMKKKEAIMLYIRCLSTGSFLVEHYTIKMVVIRYYLLSNSILLKFCKRKYEYIPIKK